MPYQPAGSINNYGLGSVTMNETAMLQNYLGTTVQITGTSSVNNAGIYAAMGGEYFGQQGLTQTTVSYQSLQYYYVASERTIRTVYTGAANLEPETEEQKAERLVREAEATAKREKAKTRARETLLFLLDPRQREQLEAENAFELEVGSRRYRIRPGRKVERLDAAGRVTSFFCAHPPTHLGLPADDIAISQKLWLETDENGFLAIANETRCGVFEGDEQLNLAA